MFAGAQWSATRTHTPVPSLLSVPLFLFLTLSAVALFFAGKKGLYLEDLFVVPEERGKGVGKALLLHLAAGANELGCGRMEWVGRRSVLFDCLGVCLCCVVRFFFF